MVDNLFRYREISFESPVTFGSDVTSGYKVNGKESAPKGDLTVHKLFTRMGKQGWELMNVLDNQYYVFKKVYKDDSKA
jgi:hypothetical protein